MHNYNTTNLATSNTDWETGEVTYKDVPNSKKSHFYGPRKYWRTMQAYDKASILLSSKVGIQILVYIKGELDLSNYRIQLNATWLAEDIGSNRETVSRNIKKLVTAGHMLKEPRGVYFVNPNMFWVTGMSDKRWQELKQEYKHKQITIRK